MNTINRLLAAVATVAIFIAGYLAFMAPVHIAPPATDRLIQMVELNQIASFAHVDARTIDVMDTTGRHFRMEFTAACPGLSDATMFSLVTENYRDLDKFTGIVLDGRVCTFKDFSPINPSPAR